MLQCLKQSLLEWNHLLTLTGGALSLEKCKVSIIKWTSNFWGRQTMTENKQNKTIAIQTNESGKNKCNVLRLEQGEAERILGIRLPMTDIMTQEYNCELKQMNDLAIEMFSALFSPRDATIVYQTHYKPMIKYALPITNFSTTQQHKIQCKFIFHLLPKIGVNRHSPRDVVYGPCESRGLGLMDLHIEQPIHSLQTYIGHTRRNDNASKCLQTTLYNT